MENIVLVVHLILALCLIGVVLLQRSEGGGLGMGGGGGGGAVSSRGVATALTKLTWVFAFCFIGTSIGLTVIAAQKTAGGSVIDRLGIEQPVAETPGLPSGSDLLPPGASATPDTPPRAD
ncbi:preprotein translocase subunit SecG [Oceaniovalibus sp. ACAM 378]|jgi:preprotein translocase subunit SecG|uniref:preprotein translocase subunit SecG n=1 Tax=Oceaniovalibus sp. ACAM 378 TaxID=2599923 RepID=UPI0011D5C667|nr:preprotein translocase subunit SecG [Oceaniovalibus sp. ACAM 378]TYB91021.1 preprotein translocase subunit SecG [Oceaniovalibus sp. ACAM 378]